MAVWRHEASDKPWVGDIFGDKPAIELGIDFFLEKSFWSVHTEMEHSMSRWDFPLIIVMWDATFNIFLFRPALLQVPPVQLRVISFPNEFSASEVLSPPVTHSIAVSGMTGSPFTSIHHVGKCWEQSKYIGRYILALLTIMCELHNHTQSYLIIKHIAHILSIKSSQITSKASFPVSFVRSRRAAIKMIKDHDAAGFTQSYTIAIYHHFPNLPQRGGVFKARKYHGLWPQSIMAPFFPTSRIFPAKDVTI